MAELMARWAAMRMAAGDAAQSFSRALADPLGHQQRLLQRILAENADCAFGQKHDFRRIDRFADYCQRVPVRGYEGFAADIARMGQGETNVLTAAPVAAFEETGGTGGAKLVPYTAEGLAGFRRAVLPWLGDLLARRPNMARGRIYATISPAVRQPRRTAGGMPIGLASDAAYLGEALAPAFGALLGVPPSLGQIPDPAEWQIATLAALVAAPDLSFVSLWSPTFLIALVGALDGHAEAVLARLTPPERQRLERAMTGAALDTALLWPALDCISCWGDGISAGYARQLGQLFPHAAIDPKGLLATEAAITIPWGPDGACVPAIDSCLIEFHDPAGQPHLCLGLQRGQVYRVVVTTQSGLYRYDLGDLVECAGYQGLMPLLRFVGRAGLVSDMVGEKLDDGFVAAALGGLDAPALLVARPDPAGYVLVLQEPRAGAATMVEAALSRNPQYAHARRIGQLAPLQVIHRRELSVQLTHSGIAQGKRLGDLKAVALVSAGNGEEWLNP